MRQTTLEYECICSDGEPANVSEYQETLPFYVCERWKGDCVEQNPEDAAAQQACLDVECGSLNPNKQTEDDDDDDDDDDDEVTATETEIETETETEVVVVDEDDDDEEDDDEEDDEESNAVSVLLGSTAASWSYFALALAGLGAINNEL